MFVCVCVHVCVHVVVACEDKNDTKELPPQESVGNRKELITWLRVPLHAFLNGQQKGPLLKPAFSSERTTLPASTNCLMAWLTAIYWCSVLFIVYS